MSHGRRRSQQRSCLTRRGTSSRVTLAVPLRAGLTLLELMLALTLTAIVLVAISMAIDLHLRVLQSRRDHVERIQLARAVLGVIATDLRSTVQQNTTDFSALASLASAALSSGAVDAALEAATGDEGSGGTGGTSGASGGTGGTSGGTGGASGGTGGTSGGTGGTSGGTGGTSGSKSGASGGTGGASGGTGSAGTGSATGTGTGTSAGSAAGAATGGTGTAGGAASGAAQDIASTGTVPPVPGLYGNQYELQVDVSRLPRVDEFQRMVNDSLNNALHDIPSDVKTVAYYCVNANSLGSSGVVNRRTGKAESGLVRRVMDRAVTLCASENGNLQGLQQAAEVVAPEVTSVEFQYFDGTQWLLEWDSAEMGGLPVAVKITMLLAASTTPDRGGSGLSSQTGDASANAEQVYSLVVRLPAAKPATSAATTDSSGMEAVGL